MSEPCAWCGEPSVRSGVIVPAMYGSRGGVRLLKKHAIEADVCAVHGAMLDRNQADRDAEAEAKRGIKPTRKR